MSKKKEGSSKSSSFEESFKMSKEQYGSIYESIATYEAFESFCQFYDLSITDIDYESLSNTERLLFKYWLEAYNKSQEFNSERGQKIYDGIMDGYRMCVHKLIKM